MPALMGLLGGHVRSITSAGWLAALGTSKSSFPIPFFPFHSFPFLTSFILDEQSPCYFNLIVSPSTRTPFFFYLKDTKKFSQLPPPAT
jgi:hypothetical protein